MPDAAGLELIANALRERDSESVVETSFYRKQPSLEIQPSSILSVLTELKQEQYGFNFLSSLHGCDYLPEEPRLGVHYELLNMRTVDRLRVKLRLSVDQPEVDSVVSIFPTAEFQEREVYDFFGVVFTGHPDLRRILMPEDYEGFPQRRDFPLGGEPVIFTKDEPTVPGWYK